MAKEIEQVIENYLKFKSLRSKSEQKLSNQNFLDKAKPELVEKEKNAFEDFKSQEEKSYQTAVQFVKSCFKTDERIYWHVQYCREKNSTLEEYSSEWFEEYLKPIEKDEFITLLADIKEFVLYYLGKT